jgi:hypothetical protein
MARILWLCPLVPHRMPGLWAPAVMAAQAGVVGPFAACWTTTDANRALPWACGVAEVTALQWTLLTSDPEIQTFWAETEQQQPLGTLPVGRRAALHAFLMVRDLPRWAATDTLETVLTRVIQSEDPHTTLATLLAALALDLESRT